MPADKVAQYNRIAIGFFLCFMELCLTENGIAFQREILTDNADDETEETFTAKYRLPLL